MAVVTTCLISWWSGSKITIYLSIDVCVSRVSCVLLYCRINVSLVMHFCRTRKRIHASSNMVFILSYTCIYSCVSHCASRIAGTILYWVPIACWLLFPLGYSLMSSNLLYCQAICTYSSTSFASHSEYMRFLLFLARSSCKISTGLSSGVHLGDFTLFLSIYLAHFKLRLPRCQNWCSPPFVVFAGARSSALVDLQLFSRSTSLRM